MIKCKICQNSSGNKIHTAYEMQFGLKEPFEYVECASCGCLQIKEIPKNMEKYYPENYFPYRSIKNPKKDPIGTFFRRQRSKYCLFGNNKIWPLRSTKYNSFKWFKKTNVTFDSSILDVGCGNGRLLNRMQRSGFHNLVGVDPFIKESVFYQNGVRILKKEIVEVEGQFDLIMCHDSFEHMPNPLDVLKKFYKLLKPNKYVLIKIPVAACFAWRHYGVNWFALDAPRHLFLHTTKSMRLLSKQTGFKVSDIEFDSNEGQFIYSELYLKDIPFVDSGKYLKDSYRPIFSQQQIEAFKVKAKELNKNNNGDHACFYLYKE